jgi:thiamine monophosphate synthase
MIFLITNSALCPRNELLGRIRTASMLGVDYILLRENTLSMAEYEELLLSAIQMMTCTRTEIVVCHRPELAEKYSLKLHSRFREFKNSFSVSTHSLEELETLSKSQIAFYGHVFETACKEGVMPRSKSPLLYSDKVIALGGVNSRTVRLLPNECRNIGIMSEWLICDDLPSLIQNYRKNGY